MKNLQSPFEQIIASIDTNSKFPTIEDWKKWYAHKSNKERVIEAEQEDDIQENTDTLEEKDEKYQSESIKEEYEVIINPVTLTGNPIENLINPPR